MSVQCLKIYNLSSLKHLSLVLTLFRRESHAFLLVVLIIVCVCG